MLVEDLARGLRARCCSIPISPCRRRSTCCRHERPDPDARRAPRRGDVGRAQVAGDRQLERREDPPDRRRRREGAGLVSPATRTRRSTSIRSGSCARSARTAARHDIPYVLELARLPFLGSANHTADYVESPGQLPGPASSTACASSPTRSNGVDLRNWKGCANSLPPRDEVLVAPRARRAVRRDRPHRPTDPSGAAVRPARRRRSSNVRLDFAYTAGARRLPRRTIVDAVRSHFPT